MGLQRLRYPKYCRWCGNQYKGTKPVGKDGFCRDACKQAHYRAYKKYVTAETSRKKVPRSDRKKR